VRVSFSFLLIGVIYIVLWCCKLNLVLGGFGYMQGYRTAFMDLKE